MSTLSGNITVTAGIYNKSISVILYDKPVLKICNNIGIEYTSLTSVGAGGTQSLYLYANRHGGICEPAALTNYLTDLSITFKNTDNTTCTWLHHNAGTSDTTITLTVDENTGESRTATISFTGKIDGVTFDTVALVITQDASSFTYALTADSVSGGSIIPLSNVSYDASGYILNSSERNYSLALYKVTYRNGTEISRVGITKDDINVSFSLPSRCTYEEGTLSVRAYSLGTTIVAATDITCTVSLKVASAVTSSFTMHQAENKIEGDPEYTVEIGAMSTLDWSATSNTVQAYCTIQYTYSSGSKTPHAEAQKVDVDSLSATVGGSAYGTVTAGASGTHIQNHTFPQNGTDNDKIITYTAYYTPSGGSTTYTKSDTVTHCHFVGSLTVSATKVTDTSYTLTFTNTGNESITFSQLSTSGFFNINTSYKDINGDTQTKTIWHSESELTNPLPVNSSFNVTVGLDSVPYSTLKLTGEFMYGASSRQVSVNVPLVVVRENGSFFESTSIEASATKVLNISLENISGSWTATASSEIASSVTITPDTVNNTLSILNNKE